MGAREGGGRPRELWHHSSDESALRLKKYEPTDLASLEGNIFASVLVEEKEV